MKTDDLLKGSPQVAPWRPRVGIVPRLSDAELVTLAVLQALLGFTSEARWLRYAHAHLRGMFPYLPQQPGYNKRLRQSAQMIRWVIGALVRDTTGWTDDVWVVDSTPVECGRSKDTAKRSDLAGWAEYGYCASHSRYFWGLRLHLLCTLHGLPVAFALTGAKADERQVLLDLLATDPTLVAGRAGQIVIAGQELLQPRLRSQLDLESPNGRTPAGVCVRVLQRLLALTAAIWHNDHTGQPVNAHSSPTTTDTGLESVI